MGTRGAIFSNNRGEDVYLNSKNGNPLKKIIKNKKIPFYECSDKDINKRAGTY